jgi:hypothetical protein
VCLSGLVLVVLVLVLLLVLLLMMMRMMLHASFKSWCWRAAVA